MNNNIFIGNNVRLAATDPEALSQAFNRWERDSEYSRLLNYDPSRLWSKNKWKEWIEHDLDKEPSTEFFFNINTLDQNQLVGFIGLMGISWSQGDCWVAIGLGEHEARGKGFGTEAMRLILRFAFTELNLQRVSLGVHEYNSRAIRSYQKVGFQQEGIQRKITQREGQHWDVIIMGILASEWLESSG